MTFEEFKDYAAENIKDYLPEDWANAEINVTRTKKLGEEYTALIVKKPGMEISPSINLEEIYKQSGGDMNAAMCRISEMACTEPEGLNLEGLTDYEQAKKDIFIRVSNVDANAELLADVPHEVIGDIAVTCHIRVMANDTGMGTILVNNALLETYGISKDRLFSDAVENSMLMNPPIIEPIEDRVMTLLGMTDIEKKDFKDMVNDMDFERDNMYILSNDTGLYGAAIILYPGVLEEIGKGIGGNFHIIPSSVHECILVHGEVEKYGELECILREINSTEVAEKDFLSDYVYYYDVKEKVLEKAADYADRKLKENEKDTEVDGGGRPKKNHKNRDYER